MHVFVFYFLLIAFSILVYMLFSYSACRLQECSIKSVSQSRARRNNLQYGPVDATGTPSLRVCASLKSCIVELCFFLPPLPGKRADKRALLLLVLLWVCLFCDKYFCFGLVAWHSGRTSVSGRRTFPVLQFTCTTIVGDPSGTDRPIFANSAFHHFVVDKWVVSWNAMRATVHTVGAIWWKLRR